MKSRWEQHVPWADQLAVGETREGAGCWGQSSGVKGSGWELRGQGVR